MIILNSKEMTAADAAAVNNTGIDSRLLMESAGREVVNVLLGRFALEAAEGIVVLAGKGNNGGDGYVIARLLKGLGYTVDLISLCPGQDLEGDAKANYEAWLHCGGEIFEFGSSDEEELEIILRSSKVLVDAIYGTGLSGAARGDGAVLINLVNTVADEEGHAVVAVDIPSGVCASSGQVHGESVLADVTVTFQALKVGQVLFPGALRCGEVFVADISIPLEIPELSEVRRTLLDAEMACDALEDFVGDPRAHKGTRGHVLVVGGSEGHVGAAKLSAQAALTSGSGLVTMLLPQSIAQQTQSFLAELMCVAAPEGEAGQFAVIDSHFLDHVLERKKCLVVGPGFGTSSGSEQVLESLLKASAERKLQLVLDADALTLLANNSSLREHLTSNAVLTPHPGEMARLLSISVEEVEEDRLKAACEAAEIYKCCVVLKGARSIIANPSGEVWINPTACNALATAGSGDVLAGVIASFLGRGLKSDEAACAAVYVHGVAGEKCREEIGVVGTLASDIIEALPLVITEILEEGEQENIPYPGKAVSYLSIS